MKTLLVTGTDTGVGKTWISALLIRQLVRQGVRTGAYKPVCSGVELDPDGNPVWSDLEALRTACGNSPPVDRICPQRFQTAVAPNVAARREGRTVDDELLMKGTDSWRSIADWLIVEGAGGIFCPLSDSSTVMELALKLNGPIIVVAANRLGVINHTRLTVQAILSQGLQVAAIILNEMGSPVSPELDPSLSTNALQLKQWIPHVPLFHCAFGGESITSMTAGKQFSQLIAAM